MPEKSGMDAALCLPPLAVPTAGATVCPDAGATAIASPRQQKEASPLRRHVNLPLVARRTLLFGASLALFIPEAGMAHIKEWKCLSGRSCAAHHPLPIRPSKALRAKRRI